MGSNTGDINPRIIGAAATADAEAAAPKVLDDLTDVDTTTTPPTDGQGLIFDEASGLWIPGLAAGGGPLHGAGAPDNALGVDGEFYIDDVAWEIYGPKAAGAWPAGVSLVGPAGPAGAAGPAGPAGPAGGSSWYAGHVPTASMFTLVSGDATFATLADDSDVGLLFDGGAPVATNKIRGAEFAIPSPNADWTFTVRAGFYAPQLQFSTVGIYCRDTVSGRLLMLGYGQDKTIQTNRATLSAFTSTPNSGGYVQEAPKWFRIKWNNAAATFDFYASMEGKQWAKLGVSETLAAFMVNKATVVGLGASYNRASGPDCLITCDYLTLA